MRTLHFTKMQGAGNDYIYVDAFSERVDDLNEEVIRKLSDRHFGVGGDGVIVIAPSAVADVKMVMYNADGSEGRMCGNGIRCVAAYAWEHRRVERRTAFGIETRSGVKTVVVGVGADGHVETVRVDMGEPILAPADVPVVYEGTRMADAPVRVNGKELKLTAVSMGNPHAVTFVKNVDGADIETPGRYIEQHPMFPERTNVEFVEIVSEREVKMRVWERGTGETLACGTGTCATVVAGVVSGRLERKVKVRVLGGEIEVEWAADNHVFMTGGAKEVFSGTVDLDRL